MAWKITWDDVKNKENPWIDIFDMRPEKDQMCIVTNYGRPIVAQYCGGIKFLHGDYESVNAYYWMPIPPAPNT